MAKSNRPTVINPLASMGLDDIVRGITASDNATGLENENAGKANETSKKTGRPRRGGRKVFEEHLARYTGINEQGIAIWLPREVKKRLELIRANASRNIPLRSLAAAIIMTYIEENDDRISKL